MRDRPSREDPARKENRLSDSEMTADELEQRQRPDGSLEEVGTVDDSADEPLSADMIEQRQRLDGTLTEASLIEDDSDEPLSADMIEQRRLIEDDDLSEDRRGE